MVVAVAVTSSSHLFHHLPRPSPPPTSQPSPSLSFFLRPLCISSSSSISISSSITATSSATTTTTAPSLSKLHPQKPLYTHKSNTLFPSLSPFSSSFSLTSNKNLIFCHSLSTSSSLLSPQTKFLDEKDLSYEESEEEIEYIDDGDEDDDERENKEESEVKSEDGEVKFEKSEILGLKRSGKLPDLTVKEKKELASYAHSLGKKLKCQLVGKSGVTENVATSFVETLEANELLKIKVHRTCPGELDDVVRRLEELTGSVVVGQIGRTVIVYRPSITKLKAEEKKKQARKVFMRKGPKPKPFFSAERTRTKTI